MKILDKLIAFVSIVIANILDVYSGMLLIAFLASLTRLFYGVPEFNKRKIDNYLFTFIRFFVMSSSIVVILYHIGTIYKWTNDQIIVVTGVSAFLSYEVITIIVRLFPIVLNKWLKRKFDGN